MTTTAIIFMVIAMILIWGGLLMAIIHLVKHPDKSLKELGLEEES